MIHSHVRDNLLSSNLYIINFALEVKIYEAGYVVNFLYEILQM